MPTWPRPDKLRPCCGSKRFLIASSGWLRYSCPVKFFSYLFYVINAYKWHLVGVTTVKKGTLMPVITLPDGSKREFDRPVSVLDVANDIGPGLAKATVAGRVNGELVDACDVIENDATLAIITP